MTLSRVETRNRKAESKQRHKRKRRRAGLINVTLIACILIGLVFIFQADRIKDMYTALTDEMRGKNQPIHIVEEPFKDEENPMASQSESEEHEPSADNSMIDETATEGTEEPEENQGDLITEENQDDQEQQGQAKSDATVQLAFVGDILLGEYINGYLEQEGYNYPFEQALFHLTAADITAGNLEMPITTVNKPASKTYVFRGKPEALSGLVYSGIDVVSLANNHTLDHGVDGMLDTRKHLDEYGIAHVGAGNNAQEAYAPVVKEVNGIKVAYVATSKVLPEVSWKATKSQAGLAESYDPTQTLKAIEDVEAEADVTVVLVHWGEERESSPIENQKQLARMYIDAGADIVIGSHPHVLQGFEQYNGKWIAYSLGNFVFSSHPRDKQAETGVLTATCNAYGECSAQFAPMKIVNAQPTPVEGKTGSTLLKFLQEVSLGGVKIDERGNLSVSK